MDFDEFSQQIEALRSKVTALLQSTDNEAISQQERLECAFKQLGIAEEELQIALEDLQQQNSELAAARAATEREQERYQELFEEAPDGYLVTDAFGIIREVNRAACTLLNARQQFVIGNSLINYIPQSERPAFRSQLNRLRQVSRVQEWEVRLIPRDGEPIDAALSVVVVRSQEAEPVALRWLIRDITKRKQAELARSESAAQIRLITDAVPVKIAYVDAQERYRFINKRYSEWFRTSPETILGKHIQDIMGPAAYQQVQGYVSKALSGEKVTYEFSKTYNDGQTRYLVVDYVPHISETGKALGFFVLAQDLTSRFQAELTLRQQTERERLVADIAQRIRQSLNLEEILNTTVVEVRQFLQTDRVIIYRFDSDHSGVVVVESIDSGWPSIVGKTIVDPDPETSVHSNKQEHIRAIEDIYTAGLTQHHIDLLTKFQVRAKLAVPIQQQEHLWGMLIAHHCKGPRQWQQLEIDLLKQLATQVAIAIQQSQLYQQLHSANQELQRLASNDSLTEVANRRRFDEYLDSEWRRLAREQAPLSLILCDIDLFKSYNDTYGHQMGDDCLRQVAKAIARAVKRSADLVARYGGEEFAVVLPHTETNGAIRVAEAIRSRVKALQIAHANSQYVTLSLGVAFTIPSHESSPATLIAAADQALYQAKEQGRDRVWANHFP